MKRLFLSAIIFLLPLVPVMAQGDDSTLQTYTDPEFGISLDIPGDWEVAVDADRLIAGTPADIEATRNFQSPSGLVITVLLGSYNSMGIQNANEVRTQLTRLAPASASVEPTNISFGNATGYAVDFEIADSPVYTQVALLSIPGARLALVRGFAPRDIWFASASEAFTQIMGTVEFTLPTNMANPLENIPDSDGGVLWHYQTAQPEERALRLGGITYDDFDIMYIAAGPSGILAINRSDGGFVNFLTPVSEDNNLLDVAIGPRDALLYFANASLDGRDRILVTDRVGNYVRSWGVEGNEPGQFAAGMPQSIAVTRQNNIWVVSEGHTVDPRDRLYRFDQFGNLLMMIDLVDINPELRHIRLDNNIYTEAIFLVGQTGGLNILDSDGTLLVPNVARELLSEAVPTDIAIGPEELIVISTENQGFLQFTSLGELVDRFGFQYDSERGGSFQPGEYRSPSGLVIDAASDIYFAETHPETGFSQVQAFEFTGAGNLALPGRPLPETGTGSPVTSSSGGEISYGATVRGTIDNNSTQHDYTFRVNSGDRIVITMRDISPRQTLDPQLVLFDVNYNEIGSNDDASNPPADLQATDSIIRFTPNSSGTYIVRATRFGGSGDYELSLVAENAQPPTETPTDTQ